MPDYTHLVHPTLRLLDCYLQMIMKKYKIRYNGTYDMFDKGTNGNYKLYNNYHTNIGSTKKISHINKCYNFYHKHRHTLFHWDEPMVGEDTTRMVRTKNEADGLIKDGLNLINQYYIVHELCI